MRAFRSHAVRALAAAAALIAVTAGSLTVSERAAADFNNPQPADAAGELVDTFTQLDAIFVIGLSDLGGGRVCIIPKDGAQDCDDPANMGPPNVIINIGTTFSLIAGPPLDVGEWRLLSESGSSGGWAPNDVSEVFTVTQCDPGECPYATGAEDAERFKAASREATKFASHVCDMYEIGAPAGAPIKVSRKTTMPDGPSGRSVASTVADAAAGALGEAIGIDLPPPSLKDWLLQGVACNVQLMHEDIVKDPPDPDFQTVEQPQFVDIPDDYPSPQLQEYVEALEEQRAYGRAVLRAYERYQGAQQASSLEHEALQIRAVADFSREYERALVRSADALEALAAAQDAASLAFTGHVPFSDDAHHELYSEFAARMLASGFLPSELQQMNSAGLSAAEVEYLRDRWGGFDPEGVAVGDSVGGALGDLAAELRLSAVEIDAFGRVASAIAFGLEASFLPGLDGEVDSLELRADDDDAQIGDEVCLTAVPRDAEGAEIRGGPMTVRLAATGALDLDLRRPYMFNHGSILSECFTFGAAAVVEFEVRIGAASDTLSVQWREQTAEEHAPWAQRTSLEVEPGESSPVTLMGGDDAGHPVTYQVLTTPQHGILTGAPPDLVYTADDDVETAFETVTFRVDDGSSFTDAQVTIYIGEDAVDPGLPVVSVDHKGASGDAYRQPAPESLRGADVVDVAGGGQTGSFALTRDGDVVAWGGTDFTSAPADAAAKYWTVPDRIAALDIVEIESDGNGYQLARSSDGTLHAWGTCENDIPRDLLGVPVHDFDASMSSGIALRADGSVFPWSRGWYGGDGDPASTCAVGATEVPASVASAQNVAVAAGALGVVALAADGAARTWWTERTDGDYDYPIAELALPADPMTRVDADLYEFWAATESGSFFGWAHHVSGTHNDVGTRRLASTETIRVLPGFGHIAPLLGVTASGEVRSLRFESSSSTYYPDNTAGIPQELLSRRVTEVSSAQLGGLVLAPPMRVVRHAGPDRYATAVAISQEGFDPGVPVVYVATGTNYPDALSAAPAAALEGGPLLLTTPWQLPAIVASEIERLDPSRIVVVGGESVVSKAVLDALAALAPVTRLWGPDRYATSRAIVDAVWDDAAIAYLATGRDFPDALSASAAAAVAGGPVLLVDGKGTGIPDATAALIADLGVDELLIAGGEAAVAAEIETAAGVVTGVSEVTRLAGANRYETSVEINRHAFGASEELFVATGTGFADALAGAALAGDRLAPLYVVPQACVPSAVAGDALRLRVITARVLGGLAALGPGVGAWQTC